MADSTSTLFSCFGRTVCLYDWWLVKAENGFEGKWLAVSGTTSRKEKALRVFVSAPVTKRYDMFSLETADGIYILIKGFINEQRTLENGFRPEVFNHFIFGFPTDWESFSVDCLRHESTTGTDLFSAVPKNVTSIDPEVLSDVVEKSAKASLESPEETSGGVNVSHDSGSNRFTTGSHNIKVCQQKKVASGVSWKHPNKEQNSTLGDLENPDQEGSQRLMALVQSQSPRQVNTLSKQLFKNSSSAIGSEVLFDVVVTGLEKSTPTSLKSPKEALTMGGVNVSHGSGSTRSQSSGVSWKHPNKKQNSALENSAGEGPESSITPVPSQSPKQVNTTPNQLVKNSSSATGLEVIFDEKSIPTSSKSPEEALGVHEKSFPREECHASKEKTGEVDVAHGRGSNRRSARLHNIKVCMQKRPASEVTQKHLDKEHHSSSGALENRDGEGLESLMTPVQSQSVPQVNTPSEKLVKKSASRASRPFSANDVRYSKKQKVMVDTNVTTSTRKKAVSAFANKYPQERDVDPLIKGGKKKISSASPLSSSFRKSRSGRMLLPPLEFWRNQLPIYNADHEITEIQEGSTGISPFKGSAPSLIRSNKKKRAA